MPPYEVNFFSALHQFNLYLGSVLICNTFKINLSKQIKGSVEIMSRPSQNQQA